MPPSFPLPVSPGPPSPPPSWYLPSGYPQVRILNRFTGLLDEEWFMKTHVIIESEVR